MNKIVTISVLLCVNKYNKWLPQAISSILNQDDTDFEFLISVNAADDSFWHYMCQLCNGDRRVKLFRTDIGQLSFNLNFLANASKNLYLMRMDADDISEAHRVRIIRDYLSNNEIDILGSQAQLINENNKNIGMLRVPLTARAIKFKLLYTTAFCHPSVVIRKEFLINQRGYLGGFNSEDTDLWIRAVRSNAKMANLSVSLLRYRLHSNQSISSRNGYSEVASHWLREFLSAGGLYSFIGLLISSVKCIIIFILPSIRSIFAFRNRE